VVGLTLWGYELFEKHGATVRFLALRFRACRGLLVTVNTEVNINITK